MVRSMLWGSFMDITDGLMDSESHGGINIEEIRSLGLRPEQILDFSVNSNPFGASPCVKEALQSLDITVYPDRNVVELREKLALLNKVPYEHVLVGNGTADLIWLTVKSLVRGRSVLIVGPTFGEYASAASAHGLIVIQENMQSTEFRVDVERIIAAIRRHSPEIVFLCNPNNPTGTILPQEEIDRIAIACGESFLILDEAYRSFCNPILFGARQRSNVLIMRSMTKDFALAGLRLGYIIGEFSVLQQIKANQTPWSVNSAAQVAGIAALSDLPFLRKTLFQTAQAAGYLYESLKKIGVKINASKTHYFLIQVSPLTGKEVRKRLLSEGIQVRDCASFGIPEYIRIATKTIEKNQLFIKTIKKLFENLGQN